MSAKFVTPALAALACALCPAASGHSDKDEAALSQVLDCDHLPKQAITRLPAPLDTWARLDCLPGGQLLAPAKDWTWRYPASFTTPVFVTAWTVDPAAAAAQVRYFTAANVTVARGDQAAALSRRFASEVEVYGGMTEGRPEPSAVYTLVAENDLGQVFEVHFLYRSNQDVWAIVCAPDCRPEYTFLVSSRGN